jgi:hypothetical protein
MRNRAAGAPSPQPSPRWGEGVLLRRAATLGCDLADAILRYGSTASVMVAS